MSRIFGEIRQNGYVVRDTDSAMAHWTQVLESSLRLSSNGPRRRR